MFIRSLEEMEKIVEQKKFLHWDGWTVVQTFNSERARTSPDGIRINGQWHIQKRFVPTSKGWEIPNKIIGSRKEKRES